MSRIVAALSTTRQSVALATQVVAEASARKAHILLLLVDEGEEIDRLYEMKADSFLMGAEPLDEILQSIEQEHALMMGEQADEIGVLAAAEGLSVERRLVRGRYDDEVARLAAEGAFDVLFWLRHNRGFIARFFLGGDEDEVVRATPGDKP